MATSPSQQILGPPPPGSDIRTKILWYAADAVATGVLWSAFTYAQAMNPAPSAEGDPEGDFWMHALVVFEDLVSTELADDQLFTLDILNWTNGQVDRTWTSTDFQLVSAEIFSFVQVYAPLMSSTYRLREVRFYPRQWLPMDEDKHWPDAGAPVYTAGSPIVGTGQAGFPPQVTSTVTEVTPQRKHWGRIYLPTPGVSVTNSSGRLLLANMSTIANAFDAMNEGLAAADFRLVVPVTSSGGQKDVTQPYDYLPKKQHALQQVTGCRIDDVVDSHRSRRHKSALQRVIVPGP